VKNERTMETAKSAYVCLAH